MKIVFEKLTALAYFIYSLYPLYLIINFIRYAGKHISPYSFVFSKSISPKAYIHGNCIVDARSSIGDYSYIAGNNLKIGGSRIYYCHIGKYCSIGLNVTTLPDGHDYTGLSTSPYKHNKVISKKIIIENDVWVGNSVLLLGGIILHTGAVVGAGAVVTKSVPPYAIVAGNPARVIKYRFSKNKIKNLLKSKWWDK